jgi:auxin response factor
MRFKMRFEGEEVPERRFSGTIVGVGDNQSTGWTDSEWRSLKVQWDEPSSILRPERVSPWELEPLISTNMPPTAQPAPRNKRTRPPVLPSPTADVPPGLGMWKTPLESTSFSYTDSQRGGETYASPKFALGFNGSSLLPPTASRNSNSIYWSNNQMDSPTESCLPPVVAKDSVEKRPNTGNSYRLFGFQLVDNSNIEETSQMPATEKDDRPIPSLDADQHSDPSNVNQSDVPSVSCEPEKSCLRSPQESQSRQTRSCTKVHMQGNAVGRAVDLTRFECYDDLLKKLETMFDIRGELRGSAKKWQVVYTDNEDDMMMVGDDPWHEFCSMVRKIFMFTPDEIKRLSSKIKLMGTKEVKTAKLDTNITVNTDDRSSIVGPGCYYVVESDPSSERK